MTTERIATVKTWLERMQVNAARAINLAERMSPHDLTESSDLFWALVKYTENVQESAVKLDGVNKEIFQSLVELDAKTWSDLKGMRSRLVHSFWSIDSDILWSTVTHDFPELLALLSSIIVIEHPVSDGEPFGFVFETQRLLGLPEVEPGAGIKSGQNIVALCFGHDTKVRVFRVGHRGPRQLVTRQNFAGRLTVYGKRKIEES